MLPNSREAMELFLAMQQVGLYLTPINFHLVGPEIAYILQDCEADAALYQAKSSGKSCCRIADAETNLAALRKLMSRAALQAAKVNVA